MDSINSGPWPAAKDNTEMTTVLIAALCIAPLMILFLLGLCRAAKDTRTVDDGRGFGGDDE